MRYLIVLSTLAVALMAAASASAGGWATVGMAPLPDGLNSGDPWNPEITILQHGETPLEGLSPTVTITEAEGRSEVFTASAAGEPGTYRASVVFPEGGLWTVVVDSTFGESRLTYGPVAIGAPTAVPPSSDSFPVLPVAVAAVAGLGLLAAALFGIRRQRRLTPASQ